jgi:hypothetical protein
MKYNKLKLDLKRYMKITILCVLFLSVYGQEMSVFEVVDSLTISIMEDQLAAVVPNKQDSIAIDVSALSPEKGEYVFTILGNMLIEKEWIVYRNFSQNRAFQGKVIKFSRFQVNRWYSDLESDSKQVLRYCSVDIKGQVFNGLTGNILKSFSGKKEDHHRINMKEMDIERKQSETSIIEQKQNLTIWDKIIEPALVASSAAIIVFLFFSQRF